MFRKSELTQDFIDRLVFEKCYNFLPKPVIVTSGGSITPFFINGENVIGPEAGDYKLHELDPVGMYNWTIEQLEKSEDFRRTMEFVRTQVNLDGYDYVSGGRTRDWPFSAALAALEQKDALFFYKPLDGSNPLLLRRDGSIVSPKDMKGTRGFHIVDLVTTASSVTGKGYWMDQALDLNSNIDIVYSLIDRNQGAERNIASRGASLQSAVKIDERWLEKFDPQNAQDVFSYLGDPDIWSMIYLGENGISCLEPYLAPGTKQANKDNRFLKFMVLNNDNLARSGLLEKILDRTDTFRAVEDKEMGVEAGESYKSAIQKYM